jgi:hypothetical protein
VGEFYEFYTIREARAEINRLRCRLDEEDRAADQLIRERDHAEGMADKLAAALATLLDVDIGEHSNLNCRWQEALDAFDERRPDQPDELPTPETGNGGTEGRAFAETTRTDQPSVCHVTWGSNPLQDVLDAFTRLYPELAVTVHIAPTEAGLGFTEFPADGSTPSICVDPGLPYSGVMDILAHELAHVAAGSAEDHGPVWQAAYDAIRDDYEREVTSRGETVAYSPEGGRASDPTPAQPADALSFSYEPPPTDVLTVEGVKYAGGLFRYLGPFGAVGDCFRIAKREDGVIWLETISPRPAAPNLSGTGVRS